MRRVITGLTVCAAMACLFASMGQALADDRTTLLQVHARNDIPGPVTLVVRAFDAKRKVIFRQAMKWSYNDNAFSTEEIEIPSASRTLQFIFVKDRYRGPGDGDRNAYIDYFRIFGNRIEAENFDDTGGTDPNYPGCAAQAKFGRILVDCGNEGDYVVYFLRPSKRQDHKRHDD